ncbi:hypothetical protein Bbelb_203150 [Branchiostoma belcheri]|nr:hypothetical protein Bbelb_203150 [Branchiostoma belcheri]
MTDPTRSSLSAVTVTNRFHRLSSSERWDGNGLRLTGPTGKMGARGDNRTNAARRALHVRPGTPVTISCHPASGGRLISRSHGAEGYWLGGAAITDPRSRRAGSDR